MPERLIGLVAAPYTAMHPDGSIALERIEQQAEALVRDGVVGAFVCGTTGEGLSLTLAERQALAARWQAVAGDRLRVIVNVSHACLADSRALAAHAEALGVAAIATTATSFLRPATVRDLVACCRDVAAAAPGLPFYYYHMPAMTGVPLSAPEFLARAAETIPTLAGIKFTSENLLEFGGCLAAEGGEYDVLFGRDEFLLAALALGARGAIGSSYNFAAPLYHRVMDAFAAGDLARAQAEQAKSMAMFTVLYAYGGLPAGKAVMGMIGIDCGPVRLPLRSLSPDQVHTLRTRLERLGAFEYFSVPTGVLAR